MESSGPKFFEDIPFFSRLKQTELQINPFKKDSGKIKKKKNVYKKEQEKWLPKQRNLNEDKFLSERLFTTIASILNFFGQFGSEILGVGSTRIVRKGNEGTSGSRFIKRTERLWIRDLLLREGFIWCKLSQL